MRKALRGRGKPAIGGQTGVRKAHSGGHRIQGCATKPDAHESCGDLTLSHATEARFAALRIERSQPACQQTELVRQ
jgi:hypothetical protein